MDAVYPAAHDLYVDLHQNPELSSHETQTASKLAARLRSLGYEVTEGVGGTGVVAILKNGADDRGKMTRFSFGMHLPHRHAITAVIPPRS